MTIKPRHRWIRGGLRADREQFISRMDLPPSIFSPVDAHARLRGPYTAGGMIVRGLAVATLRSHPGLARRHDIEFRALAPELRDAVPLMREVLAESVPPGERTRIHPMLRTRRLAHGLTDFLRDYLLELDPGPHALVIENVHHADPSDRELVATLLRRLDASLLTVVACAGDPVPGGAEGHEEGHEGQQEGADLLDDALARHATRVRVPYLRAGTVERGGRTRERGDDTASLAARYVKGDGISDDPALLGAYARLSMPERAKLHDARAEELERARVPSAWLGAIPYHRERGADPEGAGVRALREAARHCFAAGFHHGVVGLASRGRALADPDRDRENWWLFTALAASSLAALRRGVESEALYDEARSLSTDPAIHRTAAYETAMLYARHHSPGRLDPGRARQWINEAIAFAGLLPDAAERAFHLAFTSNGRALTEMRLGATGRALQIVDECLALVERELPPGSHPLDRCSLLANRARLLTAGGRLEDALACQEALVALDATYGEYHFERGNLLHLLGRDDEALAAYSKAQHLSLPFPELHYNRADLLAARGEENAALAELDRALELDPDFLDARVNRAGLLAGCGDAVAAWADVNAGLAADPGNPYLLCVLGQLEAARGRADAALEAFSAAIAARPGLAAAWAGRAALRLEAGDADAAVADLTHALEAGEDAALLFNRAVAYRAAGRSAAAARDARRALALRPGDEDTRALLSEMNADT
ncbi:MAG: tetratricopeptide repeat protein [Micromonosporaceae bacterium]